MKNIAESSIREVEIEPGFSLIRCTNTDAAQGKYIRDVASTFIQIHFAIQQTGKLVFAGGHYTMPIPEGESALLYNPNQQLPIHLELDAGAKFIILLVSIERFHRFFSEEAGLIQFLDTDQKDKKYYFKKEMSPRELVVLNEILNFHLRPSLERLFTQGKVYELLSIYFNKSDESDACPFLKDEENVKKILLAKTIIIDRVAHPPSLSELASEVGLSLKKLKDGFKQIYGDTVFNFLFEYKMDHARNLIESKKYNVSEISEMIGYTSPSHFIAAFKQKFGTTPKQYMLTV
ncbi:MAG TPA: AraC family transcriptional regulator [Saprospiraceae bacterium]|nr:AraC family transcriptional regulator [Saprospiraceae bacterium]